MPNNLIKDKTTIVSNAQKYTKKGKIDKAIAQWTKLLTVSKDAQIYNTIGDLYLKKGAEDDALDFFIKAAKMFKKNGFYSKATGIYNKILAIEPDNLDVLVASSRLNAERGLPGKAVEDFLKVSEKLIADGAEEKALETLEKALSIFPSDADIEARRKEVSSRIEINKNIIKSSGNKKRLFKWGSGRASARTPEKVKRRRKKSRSLLLRAAVFILVFPAILAVTFDDIKREAGISLPETNLTSVKDADERPLSADLEGGYPGVGTIKEYSRPVEAGNVPDIKKPEPEPVEAISGQPASEPLETAMKNEPDPERKTADLPVRLTYKKIHHPITFDIDTAISGSGSLISENDNKESAGEVVSEMGVTPGINNKLIPKIALIVKSSPVQPAVNEEPSNDTVYDGKVQN